MRRLSLAKRAAALALPLSLCLSVSACGDSSDEGDSGGASPGGEASAGATGDSGSGGRQNGTGGASGSGASSSTGGASADDLVWGQECVEQREREYVYDSSDDQRDECVARINGFRAELGLSALTRDTDGEDCADATAKKAADTGVGHPEPPPECEDVSSWAQNTCPGYGSVNQTLEYCMNQMWCEGPSASGEWEVAHGHHQNMVGGYSSVACGFHENSEGKVWLIQNFR